MTIVRFRLLLSCLLRQRHDDSAVSLVVVVVTELVAPGIAVIRELLATTQSGVPESFGHSVPTRSHKNKLAPRMK